MRHNPLYHSLLAALMAAPVAATGGELRSLVRLPAEVFGAQATADATLGSSALSADGNRVAYTSAADNLAPGGGGLQAYLFDRSAHSATMLSRGFDGLRGDAAASAVTLSSDGSHAAWVSVASNLVPGDTVGSSDVFVQRLSDGRRVRFSPPPEITAPHVRVAHEPRLAADGSHVVFSVATATGVRYAIYLGDVTTGVLTRLTPPLNGDQPEFSIGSLAFSGDGATVFYGFVYPATAVPPFTHYGGYAQDLATGTRELFTRDPDGTPVNTLPAGLAASHDGRIVAFSTLATAFVTDDTDTLADVVARDRRTGVNRLASVLPSGASATRGVATFALDPAGTTIAFALEGAFGVPGSLYRADATGATEVAAQAGPLAVAIDQQGAVAFDSRRVDLVAADGNGVRDVFVRESAGVTERVSVATTGPWPTTPCCARSFVASPSGDWLAFGGMQLAPGPQSWFGVLGRSGLEFAALAVPSGGWWDVAIEPFSIADDGDRLSLLPGTAPGSIDINPPPPPGTVLPATLLFDRLLGEELDVALTPSGGLPDGGAGGTRVSGNGRFAIFGSVAADVLPGANPQRVNQVYRRDLETGELQLVSAASPGMGGNGHSAVGGVSHDGRFVAYSSGASDLVPGDGNGSQDVFLWDANDAGNERVSVRSDGSEIWNNTIFSVAVCDDGARVAWSADAFAFVPGDGSDIRDVYVRNRESGSTWRASENPAGEGGNANANSARLSRDCSTLAFTSRSTNLGWVVPTGVTQVYVASANGPGRLELASRDRANTPGTQSSEYPALNADGSEVLFLSATGAWTLDGEQTLGVNVFARSREPGAIFADSFED